METERLSPGPRAALFLGICVLVAGLAALVDLGTEFHPRDKTIDALAGLAIGAFLIDRLLTFVPVFGVRKDPKERAADLDWLRLGWGALLAAIFVSLTDLRAVDVLSGGQDTGMSPAVDRLVATFAIAGGVAGLARLLSAINPPKPTDGKKSAADAPREGDTSIPPPSLSARVFGLAMVAVAAAIALVSIDDTEGLRLLVPETQGDGTVAIALRFGVVILAAAIVEQLLERLVAPWLTKNNKPIVVGAVAVVLGVLMARGFDLYLLHNLGFFGEANQSFEAAIEGSSKAARWGDTFLTGVAIAAGTKPLHDLSSRLRKAKAKPKT